jgi:hypothetical protein
MQQIHQGQWVHDYAPNYQYIWYYSLQLVESREPVFRPYQRLCVPWDEEPPQFDNRLEYWEKVPLLKFEETNLEWWSSYGGDEREDEHYHGSTHIRS